MLTRMLIGLRNAAGRLDPRLRQGLECIHYSIVRRQVLNTLRWRPSAPCPSRRLDAVSAQYAGLLYVFGGYVGPDEVVDRCDILDMRSRRWVDSIALPDGMGRSHAGITDDGRGRIFAVSGQPGPQCGPATVACFMLEPASRTWSRLPPLPEARYAPAVRYWNGRIHVIGGSKPDRTTPASDHWSLEVADGRVASDAWMSEPPIPVSGCHRAALVHGGSLYVLGGQQGDYIAIPGDPNYTCTGELTSESYIHHVFRLENRGGDWQRLADMPIPASHIESSWVVSDDRILVFGGQIHKDHESGRLKLTDAVQCYHITSDSWSVVGRLPYRVKNIVVGHHGGRLFVTTGQRDRGPHDDSPERITDWSWTARISSFVSRSAV